MPYTLVFTRAADKNLKRLPIDIQNLISRNIQTLSINPRPEGVKKLKGKMQYYRIRIGKYRVIYSIDDYGKIVVLRVVGHRKDVYKMMNMIVKY